jgi:hypothetical protein
VKLPVCYVCAAIGEGVIRWSGSKFVFCETCAHRYPVASGLAQEITPAPVVTPPQDEFKIEGMQFARLDPTW